MSKNYPYIQSEIKINSGVCCMCKKNKPIKRLEWRVDWFQGNCEWEDICQSCFNKRESEEKKKKEQYILLMTPIWEKQRKKAEEKENNIRKIIREAGFTLKEYSNGQWSIGDVLDWWTSTGTAIERKSKKRHYLSFKEPKKMKGILTKLNLDKT